MDYEFVKIYDAALANFKAFELWLKAVEVFMVVALFAVAYLLIKAVTTDKENEDA